MKTKPTSFILLLTTAMIWGFAFVAQVQGMEYIQSLTMIGVRFTISAVALVPVVLFFERGRVSANERIKTVKASIVTGIILFLASAFQQFGIKETGSAGVAGFITGLYTVFVPIACYLFFRKKTGINVLFGAVLAVIGLTLLCYRTDQGLTFGKGELLLLIGAFFWTAHVMVIDRMGKNVRSLHFSWGQFIVCGTLGVCSMFIFEQPSMTAILDAKWAVLYCGVLSSAVAYTLQIVAQKRSDPTVAAIVFSTESMFSAIGGVIFKIDNIAIFGYLGCVFMFMGVVISQVNFKRRKDLIE